MFVKAAAVWLLVAVQGGGTPTDPVEDRVTVLEQQLADLRAQAAARPPAVRLDGYIDFGFFAAQGDGAGYVQDVGAERRFPAHADRYAWVFLGDIMAPAVNSRGEPADLGQAPGVNRFDAIDSEGAPGFIVNEVNLTVSSAVAAGAIATASVNFAPRSGTDFRRGDGFEVDLAQVEWMPTASRRTSLFFGKMDSVLGIEYPRRKSSRRFNVTPSLVARYTTGTALGAKVRSKLLRDERLVVAAAVTNGSNVDEVFHFHDEIDSNAGKTVSGRVAYLPRLPIELEAGVSGAWGPQDRALDSRQALWFAGADLQVRLADVELRAQVLAGGGRGETDTVYASPHRTYGLRLRRGGYLEGEWMAHPALGFYGRAELRDALVWLGDPGAPGGAERAYLTKSWRATAGLRFVFNAHVVGKAEYLRNGEYGGVPSIRNDVFAASLVLVL